jgi:hypothetical protein
MSGSKKQRDRAALQAMIADKFAAMSPWLNERSVRIWAATEAMALGYGGDSLVSAATGLARETIRKGRRDLANGSIAPDRIRRPGAGRRAIEELQPGITAALKALLSRKDIAHWTNKKLAAALNGKGWRASQSTVVRLMQVNGHRKRDQRIGKFTVMS